MAQLQDKQKESMERIRQKAQAKASSFAELFRSPIGVGVLEEIKKQFDSESICAESAHETIIRAAQRDVVHWIEEVIERGNRNVEG